MPTLGVSLVHNRIHDVRLFRVTISASVLDAPLKLNKVASVSLIFVTLTQTNMVLRLF